MSTHVSELKKTVGVICLYTWKEPFTGERVNSSCFLKVHSSDQIPRRFQVRMDDIGRGNAVMTTYLTENGKELF